MVIPLHGLVLAKPLALSLAEECPNVVLYLIPEVKQVPKDINLGVP